MVQMSEKKHHITKLAFAYSSLSQENLCWFFSHIILVVSQCEGNSSQFKNKTKKKKGWGRSLS